MRLFKKLPFVLIALMIVTSCHRELIVKRPTYNYDGMDDEQIDLHKDIEEFLFLLHASKYPIYVHKNTRIENLVIDKKAQKIIVDFSELFSRSPFRESNVEQIYQELFKTIDSDYQDYNLVVRTLGQPIENLIPNYYRTDPDKWDLTRLPVKKQRPLPVVRRKDSTQTFNEGLYGHNVALWQSHGWYYNEAQDRWMWQRARLFGTVEDLLPASFVIPYIIPMLENAGANVFIPRERDVQPNEIIVDNDSILISPNMTSYSENREGIQNTWKTGDSVGFAFGNPPYPVNFNPFQGGTFRYTESDTIETAFIEWSPAIPDSGYYAVYVSYNSSPQNVSDALYTVYHTGGQSEFFVNQQIGGNTWIYLGTFKFDQGYNQNKGRVKLSNKSTSKGLLVSADAVKFGGGIGNVLRNEQPSLRPKFVEGARYWLQTAGFPDTLVYNLNKNRSDYRDDYQSRGEWVNYIYGEPNGPNKNREIKGLGIPIDASLAFHTDAGFTRNDTTIGTLQIYSVTDAEEHTLFPDGSSRFANLDFSDIMQTQIVDDLRQLFDPNWTRRMIWERQLSETVRPNVPSTLLELLSHHNYLDMKFGLDPRFRFHASRAIYKSILRFINSQYQKPYAVQPLPVTHFSAVFNESGDIRLSWKSQTDPLEPSAEAKYYKVYKRIENKGFDNGLVVNENSLTIGNPKPGVIYSFKVTALNNGGESFPSEILAVCKTEKSKEPVLIVNGFDRVAPPASLEEGNLLGFAYFLDNGVPDKYDLNYIGEQFNFDARDPWRTDDRPGHGASYADQETKVIAGNTFDFPFIHGQAVRSAGFSFISSSDEAVMDNAIDLNNYNIVDLILGEEKETGWQRSVFDSLKGKDFKTFPEKLKRKIRNYLINGGGLFVSGAYIASDLFEKKENIYPDALFARDVLHYDWVTNHAVKTGHVFATRDTTLQLPKNFAFNTDFDQHIYRVEAPDAIGPANGSKTIIRYAENGFSAGIAYNGKYKVVAFGFPFETILSEFKRYAIMDGILKFFTK